MVLSCSGVGERTTVEPVVDVGLGDVGEGFGVTAVADSERRFAVLEREGDDARARAAVTDVGGDLRRVSVHGVSISFQVVDFTWRLKKVSDGKWDELHGVARCVEPTSGGEDVEPFKGVVVRATDGIQRGVEDGLFHAFPTISVVGARLLGCGVQVRQVTQGEQVADVVGGGVVLVEEASYARRVAVAVAVDAGDGGVGIEDSDE